MCLDKDRWRCERKSGPRWRSNGEGMDRKGRVKTNIRKTDRGVAVVVDCFQAVRVIRCRPCARCQERLASAMLREKT